MNLNIIYENKDIIVVDKPAGISVHPAKSDHKSDRGASPKDEYENKPTIVSLLLNSYPGLKNIGENPLRPGIVHRLDKETSGLMVIAKNNETFYELKKQFQERKIEKKYIALISGVLEKEKGTIDKPLEKLGTRTKIFNFQFSNSKQIPNSKFPKSPKTRDAITEYKVLKHYKEYTLVEVQPKTGRQHQIRVHFASINHPIACDELYGRKAKKCPSGLSRHFLHASLLKFRLKNALMEFGSPLPRELERILEELPK